MSFLVVVSDGTEGTDACLTAALDWAAEAGSRVVVISVLSGSLVASAASPAEAGRLRRAAEDEARGAVRQQLRRVAPEAAVDTVALFGDVLSDTLLLAENLAADGVVVAADHPAAAEMRARFPVPVLAVPPS